MLAPIARKIFRPILGRLRLQRFFELLYSFSVIGLNASGPVSPRASGEIQAIKKVIKSFSHESELTIFDVGANQGDYSALVSELAPGQARIYAFEPSQKIFNDLKARLGKQKGISFYNFGFSSTTREAILYFNPLETGLSSLYVRQSDNYDISSYYQEKISLRTIDGFCAEHKIKRIHLLKLDIEGHELEALAGANGLLTDGNIDCIQFEFGQADIDSRVFFRDFYNLLNRKYLIYRIVQDGLYKIKKYKEANEIFYMTNYLAVKR